ncbi:MAG: hypothetical protein N4A49_07640 [Marinifilaceae bacterium]|nr:hypothetical protein [Marinifilaceae bacterium]
MATINKHIVYEDLYDFWLYALKESNAYNKSSRKYSDEWNGNVTWQEAKKLALRGWQKGLEEVKKYQTVISPQITEKVIRPHQIYSVAGYNVDVGRYMSNDPECFMSREYRVDNSPGRVFTLVCSISFSAAINPQTIIQRGAIICALVDAIEYAGHRAEVICNWSVSRYSDDSSRTGKRKESGWLEIDSTIKKANQPLEMIELAFCLAHPAMLRRVLFSVAEIEGWSDFAYAYGYPAEATNKGDLYISEIFSGMIPDQQAIDWVLNQLKSLNIEIKQNVL